MTALESLLTKLASDEERERLAEAFTQNYHTMDNRPVHRPDVLQHAFKTGYTAAHARMSLLVEICKIQNAALEYYRGDKVNQGFKMVDLAGDTLAKLEAMAKERA